MTAAKAGSSLLTQADRERAMKLVADEMASARGFFGEDGAGAAPLLPVLHALQREFGCISSELHADIASALNISQAEVRGVVSFYHDFRSAPAGRRILKLCRAEACQARGVEGLVAYLAARHKLQPGETTADGALSVDNVYCLGNCALGPAAMLDDDPIGRLDKARIDGLFAEAGR